MKKIKLMIIVVVSMLGACKKDSGTDNATLILGKWNVIKEVHVQTNTTNNTIITKDTTNYSTDSYIDFRTDGKAYLQFGVTGFSFKDTGNYSISGNTIVFKGRNITINSIDAHNLNTYNTSTSGIYKDENWQTFTR